jgi:DNA-binding transcriptional regulator YiaG
VLRAVGRSSVISRVASGIRRVLMAKFNDLMTRVGWSDAELSRRLSVRPGTVRKWRTSRREVPPTLLELLRMYAEAIDRLPPLPKDWTRA